jgi:signal transduction histidine kinase
MPLARGRAGRIEAEFAWTAASLVIAADALEPDVTCGAVNRRFTDDPDAPPAFAVRHGERLGLIDRETCTTTFALRFGRELYERRPVTAIMDHDPLVVEANLDIGAISALVADRKPGALRSGFVVVEDGTYRGIATGLDLMRATAEQLQALFVRQTLLRDTLVETEKLASLGSLVAGIAHEINTPLGVSLIAASQLEEASSEIHASVAAGTLRRAALTAYLENARESSRLLVSNTRRAAELVQSFKQVAVDQTSDERRTFALVAYVNDVVRSLHPQIRRAHATVTVNGPADLLVDGYPGVFAQIATNLVTNALVHAFEGRTDGTIRIAVAKRPGDAVHLACGDDGCGIPAQHVERVFEPFYTTRRGRGGSGLGLNIVYNLVRRVLGGTIRIETAADAGTTFLLDFPRVSPHRSPDQHQPRSDERTSDERPAVR